MCSSVAPRSCAWPARSRIWSSVHHVAAGVVQVGPEGAEVARVDADVGRVDVRVDVVVAEVAVVPLADQVGHRAQREQVVRRLQRQPVLEAQPLARPRPSRGSPASRLASVGMDGPTSPAGGSSARLASRRPGKGSPSDPSDGNFSPD